MGNSWGERWDRIRRRLSFSDLLIDGLGKFFMGFGLGALFASHLQPRIAWALLVGGLVLVLLTKGKYLSRSGS